MFGADVLNTSGSSSPRAVDIWELWPLRDCENQEIVMNNTIDASKLMTFSKYTQCSSKNSKTATLLLPNS